MIKKKKKGEETHNNEGTDTLHKVVCQIKHTPFSFFIFKKTEHNNIINTQELNNLTMSVVYADPQIIPQNHSLVFFLIFPVNPFYFYQASFESKH